MADGTLVADAGRMPDDVDARRPADAVRRDGHRAPRRAVRRRRPGLDRRRGGRRSRGPVRGASRRERLGAERIIAMSRHADRQALAQRLRRDRHRRPSAATTAWPGSQELLGGIGADAVLECVGTKESMQQALDATASRRPGRVRRRAGRRLRAADPPAVLGATSRVAGGVAPVRGYLPELLDDVLSGAIDPGRVSTSAPAGAGAGGVRAPWTSAGRSRRCCGRSRSAGELAVQRGEHRAGHRVGLVAPDHGRSR